MQEVINRWKLINLLLDGIPQRKISSELNISLGKIARGSRMLKYGSREFKELIESYRKENE